MKMIIGIIVAVLALVGGGYYWYTSRDSTGGESGATVSKALLSPAIKEYLDNKDKITIDKVKDFQFTQKEIYPLLKDYSQDIPFKVPEGRPNPFVPYVP